jgi:hypothetical protein
MLLTTFSVLVGVFVLTAPVLAGNSAQLIVLVLFGNLSFAP